MLDLASTVQFYTQLRYQTVCADKDGEHTSWFGGTCLRRRCIMAASIVVQRQREEWLHTDCTRRHLNGRTWTACQIFKPRLRMIMYYVFNRNDEPRSDPGDRLWGKGLLGGKDLSRVLTEYRTMHNIPTQSSEVRTPLCPDLSRGIAFQPLPCTRRQLSESTLNHNYTLAWCWRCWQKTVANVPITGILCADGAVDGLVCDKIPVTMALRIRTIPGSGLPDQVSNAIIHHVTCKIFTDFSRPGHMTAPWIIASLSTGLLIVWLDASRNKIQTGSRHPLAWLFK